MAAHFKTKPRSVSQGDNEESHHNPVAQAIYQIPDAIVEAQKSSATYLAR